MIVYDYIGTPLTFEKIVPGDTVTSPNSATMKTVSERKIEFTSGGTYVVKKGDTITGATSAATARVEAVVLLSGSWAAGTAAGFLYIDSQSGALESENLDVGSNTNVATIAGDSVRILKGLDAKGVYISVESAACHYTIDGTTPGQTGGNSYGHQIPAGEVVVILDPQAIKNLKFVDRTSGSASTIKLTCFF